MDPGDENDDGDNDANADQVYVHGVSDRQTNWTGDVTTVDNVNVFCSTPATSVEPDLPAAVIKVEIHVGVPNGAIEVKMYIGRFVIIDIDTSYEAAINKNIDTSDAVFKQLVTQAVDPVDRDIKMRCKAVAEYAAIYNAIGNVSNSF